MKPANILFGADGVPKVADFGLAKQIESTLGTRATGTGAILGTPAYMAPEQVGSAARAGPACNVYSLGAALYECLTGRPPVIGSSNTETLLLLRTQIPPPADAINPQVPAALASICAICLEKNPDNRYPDARSLAAVLTAFLEGKLAPASASAAVVPRRPLSFWLALVSTSLAVLLGILALKWKLERDDLAEELRTLQGR